jgi:hypothetical protein
LTYQELQDKYNIKTTTLSLINQGKKYRQENEIYPLRKKSSSTLRIFTETEMQ